MSHDPRLPVDDAALRAILEGTATRAGTDFFEAFVRNLAVALGVKCAWVTEWLEDRRRLRALAFWVGDHFHGDYEYDVAGTPCEPVIDSRTFVHVPDRVIELFASDPDLPPLGAVSYMGIPLVDDDDRLLGHLAVLHDEPLPEEDPRTRAIFEIFAGRASAELRRLRRERALVERERKLSRLFASALDSIVELDAGLNVVGMNPAAERVFACHAAHVVGKPFSVFLPPDSRRKIASLCEELRRDPGPAPSVWITGGMPMLRAGGTEGFVAEATLSRYETEGQPFHALILRNVDELRQAQERIESLLGQTDYLRQELRAAQGSGEIVGDSPSMRRVLGDVAQVAVSDATVLVRGETGTGKELVARAIHERSRRASHPLVRVNCAAIATTLVESEFFGHEKGAFTGATQRREGRFRLAHRGTIFLDEIGELPLDLQAKLLRVLQEGEFEAVGSSRTERVDVRVIAATNRDLEAMVGDGSFREDLYYRLNVFPIEVPPLRERGDDVVTLAEVFAMRFARRAGGAMPVIDEATRRRLRAYRWPGNVRELQNVIERALIVGRDPRRLDLDQCLPLDVAPAVETIAAFEPAPVLTDAEMRAFERANVERALAKAGGKISGPGGAAELLGLHPNTLSSRLKSLGLDRSGPGLAPTRPDAA